MQAQPVFHEPQDGHTLGEETTLYDASYDCLILFEDIIANPSIVTITDKEEHNDLQRRFIDEQEHNGLKSQYNSFLLWVDYTGALSLKKSSLDARLRGFADISAMVLELLEMIVRNLSRCKCL